MAWPSPNQARANVGASSSARPRPAELLRRDFRRHNRHDQRETEFKLPSEEIALRLFAITHNKIETIYGYIASAKP
jgi:hypothetical protein